MTTEQGNKLIAEFMQEEGISAIFQTEPFVTEVKISYGMINQLENQGAEVRLYYHDNWNKLMPVVEKISTIHYGWENKEDEFDDCAYTRTFGMRDKDGNYMVRINAQPVFIAPKLIDATWQAVVWFIENNKNNLNG